MEQFDSSVFDGPILGMIYGVFDVRRHFMDGIFVEQFGVRIRFLEIHDFQCLECCPAGAVDS